MISKNRLFRFISIAAAIYTGVEIFMQSMGTSICVTEGCKIISSHTRFGDISILIIGLSIFIFLSGLTFLEERLNGPYRNIINILLISALAAEGFFTGYQIFHVKTLCLFCLSIFGLIITLSIIRLLSGERIILAGFASFATVFLLLYLVLPAGVTETPPSNVRLILFYSDDCRHCAEIKKKMEDEGIKAEYLKARDYSGFLKLAGVEHVPTLFVNEPFRKMFITGKESIEYFLFKNSIKGRVLPKKKRDSQENESLDIFNVPSEIFIKSDEPGVCREDIQTEKCK